jgi:hypothetical protein
MSRSSAVRHPVHANAATPEHCAALVNGANSILHGDDIGGFNTPMGCAVEGDTIARILAHEILHQCGLEDIYCDKGGVSLSSSTTLVPANRPTFPPTSPLSLARACATVVPNCAAR